jgi:hypothetical protein
MPKSLRWIAPLLWLAGASRVDAQTARFPRPVAENAIGFVSASLAIKMTSTSFDATTHPVDFVEAATVQSTYDVPKATEFDLGAGVHVTRSVAVGVSVSRFTKGGDVSVAAQIPHPFFFNRLRPVSGTSADLAREETGLHARLLWVGTVAPMWIVSIGGGPSLFRIGQDLVDDITVDQTYPYDTATLRGVVATRHTGSAVGFNIVADVTHLLTRHLGVGIAGGFSRGKVDLTTTDNQTMTVDAGGAQVSGGVRLHF